MTGLFEAAWVIARRDFVATVWLRSFILFLLAPLALFAVTMISSQLIDNREGDSLRPQVAVIADGPTATALENARTRLAAGTSDWSFPVLRAVDPAENVRVQAGRLLADDAEGFSAVFSGTLDHPVLTGPAKVDANVGRRIQLLVDEARRTAALEVSRQTPLPVTIERVLIDQSSGHLQMTRRLIARSVQMMIFGITVLLATLLLSNMAEEKSNKVIEVLAAAVPLDSIFLGKLFAMLGISFVGLALWGGLGVLAYLFVQIVQDWVTLPQAGPAVGWPVFILLVLLYYGTNYMLLGALFLGIGSQASNIREIQTISMPVTLLQVVVVLIAVAAVGDDGALAWFAAIFPFSSPLAMIAHAARFESLWPHLLALAWQAIWVVVIIRASSRLFRRTVLKSTPGGTFFNLDFLRRPGSR